MLTFGCGYVQKGVVMSQVVWLFLKRCGYVSTNSIHTYHKNGVAGVAISKIKVAEDYRIDY